MIRLSQVSKSFRAAEGRRVILDCADVEIHPGHSFGILGANGAGKSTLLRMLAGVEMPDNGHISRKGRVSFPLGFGGTFHPQLSGRENVTFLARVYGASVSKTLRFVEEFGELGDYMRMPVSTYSSGMLAKLTFGACLSIDFDVFLIDEVIAVGDARFQARCKEAFDARMANADIIMVSHSFQTIRTYCDSGGVLSDGRLAMFEDLEDAIGVHTRNMSTGGIREPGVRR